MSLKVVKMENVYKLAKIGLTASAISPKSLKIRPTSFLDLLYTSRIAINRRRKLNGIQQYGFLAVLGRVAAFWVGKLPKISQKLPKKTPNRQN